MPLYNTVISNAVLDDMPQATVKGRAAGAGTGDPQDLTQAQLVGVLDTSNVTLTKQLSVNVGSDFVAASLIDTTAGGGAGPCLILDRNAAPAGFLGEIYFTGRNNANTFTAYSIISSQIFNGTVGAETGQGRLLAMYNGGYQEDLSWSNGVRIGQPGGGFTGTGTINSGGYYVHGTLFMDGAGLKTNTIADGSINAAKIQPYTITDYQIAGNSINGDRIIENTLTVNKLQDMPPGYIMCREWNAGAGDPQHQHYDTVLKQMATYVGGDVQWYSRGIWHQPDGANIDNPNGNYGAIQIQAVAAGPYSAIIAFHRPGAFAAYFGLHYDNQLRWGGWSLGSAAYQVFNQSYIASKADMEGAGATHVPTTPWNMIYHHGVAKGWALVNYAEGRGQTYNLAYASRLGVGRMRFHWSPGSFANIYPCYIPNHEVAGEVGMVTYIREWAEWWCTVVTWEVTTNTWYDPTHFLCEVHAYFP